MKFAFALVTLTALAFVPAANAADARLSDCLQLSKQVSAALETAKADASTEAAREQANSGRSFCGAKLYIQGVASYTKALQLLGKS